MANWAEGVLRVHGRNKDLINFMKNGFREASCSGVPAPEVKTINDEVILHCEGELYVRGSYRMLSEDKEISFDWDGEPEKESTVAFNVKQAWTVLSEDLQTLSQKYKINFRITAYEKGMEFSQEIEVIEGKITKEILRKYNDYLWECENPLIGG